MINLNKQYTTWSPRLLSLMRIVISLLFMCHGGQKLFGIPSDHPFHAFPLMSLLWIAGVLEFYGGIFLLLGLFTRPVAFVLSGEMAVAYFIAHFPRGFWPLLNHGELAVLYCFVFLYFVAAGGGAWSIDALRTHLVRKNGTQAA
jgi:putative oxidoreductase